MLWFSFSNLRVRQRRGELAARVLLADWRFAGEIKAIVLAEARKIRVLQLGAGNVEDAALWNVGDVPRGLKGEEFEDLVRRACAPG